MEKVIDYDCAYFYNMLRMYSPTAKEICKARWDFISEVNAKTVLDFGSGCGFFKAFAPAGIEVDTFDIMPVPQTGITRSKYDVVCFFDVIEHVDWLKNPDAKIEEAIQMGEFVFITVPILPIGKSFKSWKHRKPGEHLTRFNSMDSVVHFFGRRGYAFIKAGTPECPPREDIYSLLFKRKP